jgi:DNA-binding CsgD family transcriptional regulator
MIDPNRFQYALERVYEAAARPELWRSALGELAATVNGYGAFMLHHRPEGAVLHAASDSMEPFLTAFFAEGWNRNNPREILARALRVDPDEIMTDATLPEVTDAAYQRWQSGFLDRFGLMHFLSVFLLGGYVPAPFALTVERARRSGPFSADEIAAMKAALPHFRRAARLTIAVGEAAQSGMVDAFSALNRAAILLDDLGAVVRLNAPAEALLGDALLISRGRLRASASGADRGLTELVNSVCRPDAAIATPKADAIAVRREFGPPLVVQAAPLVNAARDIFQRARAILLIMPLHRLPEVGEAILHQAFGLTPAEVSLARLVIAGKGMPEAAVELRVSVHTTRTHLKSMFAKTQTRSQSELAVMLSRLSGG